MTPWTRGTTSSRLRVSLVCAATFVALGSVLAGLSYARVITLPSPIRAMFHLFSINLPSSAPVKSSPVQPVNGGSNLSPSPSVGSGLTAPRPAMPSADPSGPPHDSSGGQGPRHGDGTHGNGKGDSSHGSHKGVSPHGGGHGDSPNNPGGDNCQLPPSGDVHRCLPTPH